MNKLTLPKILPLNQCNCEEHENLINEIREIRNANIDLKKRNKDGTILIIDFNNAFRSISLRWFNLVKQVVFNLRFWFVLGYYHWFWNTLDWPFNPLYQSPFGLFVEGHGWSAGRWACPAPWCASWAALLAAASGSPVPISYSLPCKVRHWTLTAANEIFLLIYPTPWPSPQPLSSLP